MPAKKKLGKKPAAAAAAETETDAVNRIDVQYNPDIIAGLLDELQRQVEHKAQQIRKDIDFMVTSIKQTFHLELIKLPTQVKQMSLSRFQKEFGDSLDANTLVGLIKTQSITSQSSASAAPSASFSSAAAMKGKGVFQTPSHGKLQESMLLRNRAPKEGEIILSANGSPLGEFSTVIKAPRGAPALVPATPGVFVPLGIKGEVVDLGAFDVGTMSKEAKEDALTKMKMMVDNMQALMAKLGSSGVSLATQR